MHSHGARLQNDPKKRQLPSSSSCWDREVCPLVLIPRKQLCARPRDQQHPWGMEIPWGMELPKPPRGQRPRSPCLSCPFLVSFGSGRGGMVGESAEDVCGVMFVGIWDVYRDRAPAWIFSGTAWGNNLLSTQAKNLNKINLYPKYVAKSSLSEPGGFSDTGFAGMRSWIYTWIISRGKDRREEHNSSS